MESRMAVQKANYIWRDFETDGVSASGFHKPVNGEIRERGTWVESAITAGLSNGGLIYDTKANMNADLAHAANASAWVIADSTVANNGIYRKSGVSGAGSWTRIADLPYTVVYAQNAGAGTANAVQATTSVPVSASAYSQLISVPFTADNTGAMTLSINGETPRALVTNTGAAITSGYVQAGMSALVQVDSEGNYRLFSYGDAAAIQAAVEALLVEAEAARDAAAASANTAVTAAASAAAVSGASVSIYREPVDRDNGGYAVQAGMTRLAWSGDAPDQYANYWLDYNRRYQVDAGDAKHHFHMYGDITVPTGTTGGQITGHYGHLDVDPATVVAGVTIDSIYPIRGNGTMSGDGVVTAFAGVYGGARVISPSAGSITFAYGGRFEAANETTGGGTIGTGYGSYNEVRNVNGGVISSAYGVYSYVRNQSAGGGITSGYGIRVELQSAGAGVTTYYGYYSNLASGTGRYANYHSGSAISYFAGDAGFGGSPATAKLTAQSTDNRPALYARASLASGYTSIVGRFIADVAPGTGYKLISAEASAGTDAKWYVRGDGATYQDGPTNNAGADYAELHEWEDGNAAGEDRRGVSVVLVAGKIRPATADDAPQDILGVVSVNPVVVGDADMGVWKQMYLHDDFGSLVYEDCQLLKVQRLERTETEIDSAATEAAEAEYLAQHEALLDRITRADDQPTREKARAELSALRRPPPVDKSVEVWIDTFVALETVPAGSAEWTAGEDRYRRIEGATPIADKRPKLNPAYDPDRPYVSREDRPEWAAIGTMGKLRLRKGQPVGARWIKMRDVSDQVEEWYVR
jgi:hypothetical protein